MKKTIIIAIVLTIGGHAYAQKNLYFGINFIAQKTTLFNKEDLHKDKGDPDLNLKYHNPTNFNSKGLALGYTFTPYWGLEVNVISSYQGQKYSGIMGDSSDPSNYSRLVALETKLANENLKGAYTARVKLNCLKIPLMVRFTSDNTKRIFATLHAGPQINILRSVTHEINGVEHTYPGIGIEPKDLYKKTTIEGVLALGLGINLFKNFLFTAQLRGDWGFQNIEKKKMTYTYQGTSQRFFGERRPATYNGTVGVSVGIVYKLIFGK